jgi:branched-chain amino acid transport system ATP-binding protein
MALLEMTDVRASYGRIRALAGVTLTVELGEIVAIVGPNGAGKSSTLNAVTGVLRPLSGQVLFKGQSILNQSLENTVRHGIAMVPEGRRVLSSMSVRENLLLGGTIRRDRSALLSDIAGMMEHFPILGQRRHEAAGRLSGGEQQMLVIARAMLSRPALLMVDEPSLGLAPKITDQIYEMMKELRANGTTILVVEQNAERAFGAADRIYVLNGGEVRLSGPAAELQSHPDFEAAYFGILNSGASDVAGNG